MKRKTILSLSLGLLLFSGQFVANVSASADSLQGFVSVIRVGEVYHANTYLGPDLVYESVTFTFDGVSTISKSGSFAATKPGVLTVEYDYHYSSDTHTSIAKGKSEVRILPEAVSQATALYRLYNPNTGEHFYTKGVYERDSLVKAGWRNEGVAEQAPVIDTSAPVYRLYNPNSGLHHYTTGQYEKDYLVSLGWRSEGIGWYSNSDSSAGIPLYRVYNPNSGQHLYTVGMLERDHLVSLGWQYEKIAWYGLMD